MKNVPQPHPPVLISFVTVALVRAFSTGQGLQGGDAAASSKTVISLNDFMKNVDRSRGQVSLEGVVSAVVPEQQAISLLDTKEFEACGVTACAQLTLPVQWRGPMPAVSDLRVEGQAQEVRDKLMFVADTLEKVVRPLPGTGPGTSPMGCHTRRVPWAPFRSRGITGRRWTMCICAPPAATRGEGSPWPPAAMPPR